MKNHDIKIIVNADDFGKDERTTLAIMESFRKGYINQTTLMVNMPWAEKAVELAKREGFADRVGLHLNLTETPLGKRITIPSGKVLRREIQSQIEKFLSFNLSLKHCDSHHHVHFKPKVGIVLMSLLRQYGFKSVRRPYNLNIGCSLRGLAQYVRNGMFVWYASINGLKTTRRFGGVPENDNLDDIEIMVHPVFATNGKLINVEHFDRASGRPLAGRPMSNLHGEVVEL